MGSYCKLPQDSPLSVLAGVPAVIPAWDTPESVLTVEICNSDKPFIPIAMRQHILGPYPLDRNLLSQGIPPDDRTTADKRIFGPVEGTPLPLGAVPRGTPPGRGEQLHHRARWAPQHHRRRRSASMSTQAKDFPPIAPCSMSRCRANFHHRHPLGPERHWSAIS